MNKNKAYDNLIYYVDEIMKDSIEFKKVPTFKNIMQQTQGEELKVKEEVTPIDTFDFKKYPYPEFKYYVSSSASYTPLSLDLIKGDSVVMKGDTFNAQPLEEFPHIEATPEFNNVFHKLNKIPNAFISNDTRNRIYNLKPFLKQQLFGSKETDPEVSKNWSLLACHIIDNQEEKEIIQSCVDNLTKLKENYVTKK